MLSLGAGLMNEVEKRRHITGDAKGLRLYRVEADWDRGRWRQMEADRDRGRWKQIEADWDRAEDARSRIDARQIEGNSTALFQIQSPFVATIKIRCFFNRLLSGKH